MMWCPEGRQRTSGPWLPRPHNGSSPAWHCPVPYRGDTTSSAGIFDQHKAPPPRILLHLLVSEIFLCPGIPWHPPVKLQALTSIILIFYIFPLSQGYCNQKPCLLLPGNCCFLLEHERHMGKKIQDLATFPAWERENHL